MCTCVITEGTGVHGLCLQSKKKKSMKAVKTTPPINGEGATLVPGTAKLLHHKGKERNRWRSNTCALCSTRPIDLATYSTQECELVCKHIVTQKCELVSKAHNYTYVPVYVPVHTHKITHACTCALTCALLHKR